MNWRQRVGRRSYLVFGLLFLCAAAPLMFIVAGRASRTVVVRHGLVVEEVVPGPALEGNVVGDPVQRPALVYLPPGYGEEKARRYPVIYLLHGYQGGYREWMDMGGGWNIRDVMDRLIAAGDCREEIIIMPDARNRYGGSFYCDSATSGNWEQFVCKDLVGFMDKKYRTLARASSRGIAGHSMGGYGAILLGMKHPDIFAAVYGLSPACLGWAEELSTTNPAWDQAQEFTSFDDLEPGFGRPFLAQLFVAMAAAWSANPKQPPLFVDLPVKGTGGERRRQEEVCARWRAHMPVELVDTYRANLARLRGIAFDVGNRDQLQHIPMTSRQFAQGLKRNSIPHTFEVYEGDHNNHITLRIQMKMLPFFSRVLATEAGPG